jgi:hypothetical protein
MEGLYILLLLMAPLAPQVISAGTVSAGTIAISTEPAAAITVTDCETDFADVLPADNRFDDRPIEDWGDKDDGCDPWPQNEREF